MNWCVPTLVKHYYQFLGAYEKIRKAANSAVMSAHLIIEIQHLARAGQIFLKFCIGGVSLSCVEKIQVWLMLDECNRYLVYVYD